MPRRTERLALGFRSHSGWANAVVVRGSLEHLEIVTRTRVELIDSALPRQVYHAAEGQPLTRAAALVTRVEAAVGAASTRAIEALIADSSSNGRIVAAGIVGEPQEIPDLARILSSHALLHMAEGQLYVQALGEAAAQVGLEVSHLAPKGTIATAATELEVDAGRLEQTLKDAGRALGPPWQKDHREAVAAALVALLSRAGSGGRGARRR
jgi:hypothetical protein